MICPFCASENIFYSKKRTIYLCEDCDASFDTPAFNKGMRIFISYGHDKNASVVSEIKEYLNKHGYDVWIDTSEIPHGADWRERITNGIIGSNGILSFLSKHSVRKPGVCIDELKIAVCLKHAYLKTVLLEDEADVRPPRFVSNTQWIDLSDWENVSEADWEPFFENKMQEILTMLNSDDALNYNSEIELLAKKLDVFDNNTRTEHLLKQVFIGREWLAKEVHTWMNTTDSQTMMIYGVPGSGKSAFSANLSQYNPNIIGSMFFEWNNTALTDIDYVVKLLALNLAVRLPDYRKMLCNLLPEEKEAKKFIENYHGDALFDLLVLNPLQCCINGSRDTYAFVFDGLDETSSNVTELLLRKAQQFPAWLKIIFTSRYDETESLKYCIDNTVFLDNTSEDNEKDIEEYIAFRLQKDKTLCRKISEKCEGSFMYAKTLCDSVNNGKLAVDEIDSIPAGINLFYMDFFNRLFKNSDTYKNAKTFLELLCVEDELPEELFRKCLKLDKYELWEIRNTLKSLVQNATTDKYRNFKTFKFVHKSIKDWLTTIELSGKYFIDPANGYKTLISLNGGVYKSDSITFEDDNTKWFYNNNYPKWLIKAGYYDNYRDLLLNSFDVSEIENVLNDKEIEQKSLRYTYYYKFFQLWKWADLLPLNYPMENILNVAKDIVFFPKKYMVSNFSHRSFQISLLILQYCMDSGRFAPIFFELMNLYKFDAYFRSAVSDDLGETRDGWDKYYMTRDAVICLKKCDAKGITVPVSVRATCEKMKISYHYYWGKAYAGGCSKELFSEPELLKDVCILPTEKDNLYFIKGCQKYNNCSLIYYLTHSDEEDVSFIKTCIDNFAELDFACDQAILAINSDAEKHFNQTQIKNVVRRIEFIKKLKQKFENTF